MIHGLFANLGAVLGGFVTLALLILNILRLFYGRWFFRTYNSPKMKPSV